MELQEFPAETAQERETRKWFPKAHIMCIQVHLYAKYKTQIISIKIKIKVSPMAQRVKLLNLFKIRQNQTINRS